MPNTNEPTATSEILRLAVLSPIEYDLQRKEAAERLNIRTDTLDKEVKLARVHTQDIASGNGQNLSMPEDETYPEPVDGAALLNELANTFSRYAVMPPHADTALALWVAFTWCIESVNVAPILALSSPEKQCGKTTVLTMVNNLSARAVPTSNITPAALFRAIEAWQPTIIIDEADTFIRESDELRGVINSGHTRTTAFVIRTVGDEHEPKRFSTWSAKAIALIGKLPDTLHDRSIVIELRRKLVHEITKKLRHADMDAFTILRSKLKRFSEDSKSALRIIRPALPENISDRAADNWEPLLAIAQLAGAKWPEKALNAALALSARANDATSRGTELLADIEGIFDDLRCDKIPSHHLIKALCDDEEMPWATYNRGHQISPRQVAKLLGEYGIHSKTIRLSPTNTPKGYEKSQFDDAFLRYLRPGGIEATPPQSRKYNVNTVADFDSVADTRYHSATEKPSVSGHCVIVADEKDYTDEELLESFRQKAPVDSSASPKNVLEDDSLPF